MSILLLAKNNKISLEDPLTKYFSSFPAYGKKIKIKHLLTHSSGLIDYEDLMPTTQQKQLHDTNCLQLMYKANGLYFAPGSQYKYSNTGYAILALIVEKISGQDYGVFLKENIFKPLKMKKFLGTMSLTFLILLAFGQNKNLIRGKVTDRTNQQPVAGAVPRRCGQRGPALAAAAAAEPADAEPVAARAAGAAITSCSKRPSRS